MNRLELPDIVRGYNPHPGQRRFHRLAYGADPFYIVMRTPRQWGKTLALLSECTSRCIAEKTTHLWYVTPYFKQTAEIFKRKLMPALQPLIDSKCVTYVNKTSYEIEFFNGAVWQFQSAENYEALRSATITDLFCDEFAFFRPEAYPQALAPMLLQQGRRACFASTPFGKNQFYEYDQMGVTRVPNWRSFSSSLREVGNPRILKMAESFKVQMSADVWRQEYEAEYIENGGSVFRNLDKLFSMQDWGEDDGTVFVGIDLGQHHDRTVAVALNWQGQMVAFKRFELHEQREADVLSEALREWLEQFRNVHGFMEINFNEAMHSFFKWDFRNLKAWRTDNENKSVIINGLIALIDTRKIAAPDIKETKWLRKELSDMQVGTTAVKKLYKYSAPSGGYDDCVMALALAAHAFRKKVLRGRLSVSDDE